MEGRMTYAWERNILSRDYLFAEEGTQMLYEKRMLSHSLLFVEY
jgi:hypothetical protein